MNLLRSVVAFLLLAAAAAFGVGGAVAQWADRAARTSGPMREIVAPITHFETTRSALAGVLTERAVSEIPTIAEAVPGLTGLIEGLISDAVAATLDDPGVDRAWIAALDSTRAGVVADIEGYDGGTPRPCGSTSRPSAIWRGTGWSPPLRTASSRSSRRSRGPPSCARRWCGSTPPRRNSRRVP